MSIHDELYAECEIEFQPMEEVLDAILNNCSGGESHSELDGWSEIIGQFGSLCDGGGAERLWGLMDQEIQQMLNV